MNAVQAAVRASRQFAGGASCARLAGLGQGLINDTYLVSDEAFSFVLQRINRTVFPDPPAIMANLRVLTEHVAGQANTPDGWRLPKLIPTLTGEVLYRDDDGDYWRAISFIDNTCNLKALKTSDQASEVGKALGRFHCWVHDLPVDRLQDTLPGFHVTPRYLEHFDQVLDDSPQIEMSGEVSEALAFVAAHRGNVDVLEEASRRGLLKQRVIHGDPKLDNVLFDMDSGLAVSLIDLDTVKPGLIHYDLGDCLRSSCNAARLVGETAPVFDVGLFSAIMRGYLGEAREILTQSDKDYLYDAICLLPFELGLRFLNDHLCGDVYFKVDRPGDNLSRALGQFKLAISIERQESEIRKTIAGLF